MRQMLRVVFLLSAGLFFTQPARADSAPPLPVIPAKAFKITDYGAVADGKTLATDAMNRAIHAVVAAGGGSVVVPAGTYLIGPFSLASHLDLHLDTGAVLLVTDDTSKFQMHGRAYENCITADNCQDISITGTGTIDGQGEKWWTEFKKEKETPAGPVHRPFLVVLRHCTRVLVKGITLINSPMFHLVPSSCRDVTIEDVHFIAPAKAPNTDGLDPSGWNFLITRCTFDVGDDCIAVKAGEQAEARQLSCEDFLITDCTLHHGHGLSIGGQTNGGLRNMTVRDCTFEGTDTGIRMKAGRGAGGLVEDVTYENLKMNNVKVPILITSYYPLKSPDPATDPAQPMSPTTPIWRHIRITHLTATNATSAVQMFGLPESPVDDVVMTDVHFQAEKGVQLIHVRGIRIIDSTLRAKIPPTLQVIDGDESGMNFNIQPR